MEEASSSASQYNVSVANSYENLSDIENEFINISRKRQRPANLIPKPKIIKEIVPVIKAYNLNIKIVNECLISTLGKNNFEIKNINKNLSHIFTKTNVLHKKTLKILSDLKNQYYTYTSKEMKPVSLLLKGIHASYDIEDITAAIKEQLGINSPKLIKVARFSTAHTKNNDIKLTSYFVQFQPNTKIQEILDIKHILHQRTIWELYKTKSYSQCKNCQRYGHVSVNCSMNYRCVKCTAEHKPGECPLNMYETEKDTSGCDIPKRTIDGVLIIKKDSQGKPLKQLDITGNPITPTCVMCGETGHPASWRGCTQYKSYIKKKTRYNQSTSSATAATTTT